MAVSATHPPHSFVEGFRKRFGVLYYVEIWVGAGHAQLSFVGVGSEGNEARWRLLARWPRTRSGRCKIPELSRGRTRSSQ